jgi:two-component system response regulator HydG
VPPLRDRQNDIMLFAQHFLSIANKELGKQVKGFSPDVEIVFKNYVWHGNLRELKNVINRATLLTDTEYIQVGAIPFEVTNHNKLQFDSNVGLSQDSDLPDEAIGQGMSKKVGLKAATLDAEFVIIQDTLKLVNYNKSKAAKLLNIDRKTIYNKIKQFERINAKIDV